MQTISISELQRNLHKIDHLDIAEIVDKKRNQIKGYFLSKKYRDFVEGLSDQKDNKNKDFFDSLRNRNIKIDPSIDIDALMNEMNDGLS